MTLRTLNYGNYGIFLIVGNAGFCPSTVSPKGTRKGTLEETVKGTLKSYYKASFIRAPLRATIKDP